MGSLRRLAYLGALVTIVVDGGYLALLNRTTGLGHFSPRAGFVSGLLLAVAACAVVATFERSQRHTPLLLAFSGASALALGILGIVSIGAGMLLAGGLFIAALITASRPPLAPAARAGQISAGVTLGIAVVCIGFFAAPLGP